MAFLSTTKIGENYGIKASPYLFSYLMEEGYIVKPNKKYELTDKGRQYGRMFKSPQGEEWIVWNEWKILEVLNILKRKIISESKLDIRLFHMVHINNLESILTKGLLSHSKMLNTSYTDISNKDVNSRRADKEPFFNNSIHDYVPFYYNVRNAMLYRVQQEYGENIIILEFDLQASFQKHTLFADRNASTKDVVFCNCLKDFLDYADWKTVYSLTWFGKEAEVKQKMMAECLVLGEVEKNS